ncbi:MAG: bifunctional DNA-binding transcriptional regulator/O6-methylguanine-DNA methyltransferase Ada [Acidobacteriia bacterium]|nr:bifunctional DNA-binding transcriptional regulator/O6-methylguanine-DNA methyltransferase Ada [Terriglobia bacterium]
MLDAEQCWEAVRRRDRGFDGLFFFGVRTTGVYCKPSCPARQPLRRNVRFYSTTAAAEREGLRPCKRCRPESAPGAGLTRIHELCRYIETHRDEPLTLEHLAAYAGLSRFHLQRTFKAAVGLSPKQYADACRVQSLKGALKESKDVAAAVYEAGFGSSSRVYERSDARLGMTPNRYRQGGRGLQITYATAPSPLGLLLIAATDRGVCFVQFGKTATALREALSQEYPDAALEPMRQPPSREFHRWMEGLRRYLEGGQPILALPLDVRATAFRMRVWNYLQTIPYGEVRSYRDVAAALGKPTAARAVARACASNRVALAIPCHRVIRGTGELGGYRWGLDRKRALLAMEKAQL